MQLLYFDRIKCDAIDVKRTRPAICEWTSEKAKYRESFEKNTFIRFGSGELNEPFEEEILTEEVNSLYYHLYTTLHYDY